MADETWVVTMPKLGETVTEGTVGSWLKQVGDTVHFDDPLFEVSTDKVDSEIPSPYDGVILEILVPAGETVPVGAEVVRIGPTGSTPADSTTDGSGAGQQQSGSSAGSGSGSAPEVGSEVAAISAEPLDESPAGVSGMAEGAGTVHDLTMPKLGETVTEGTIGSWLKQVGDTVSFDDSVFEVSTDKVDSEIPSPHDGVLVEILVAAGETVPIGTVVARIAEEGAVETSGSGGGSATPNQGQPAAAPAVGSAEVQQTPGAVPGKTYSPIVRRLAAENGIDLGAVTGTGAGGRIRREDVQAAIANRPTETSAPRTATAKSAPAATPTAPAAGMGPQDVPAIPGVPDERDRVESLSRMRLTIAAGMVRSLQISPHVWTSIEVDYENVEIARRKHKEAYKAATGASLSYLTFVARATCDALLKFPAVNSSVDVPNKTQTFHPYVNLGIAVDLDEKGLIVPVVPDADQLNLKGIGIRIKEQADKGRRGRLGPDEMKGSTFTITNVGPFQSYASAPIINQPNVAIMCTDGVSRKPVAVGDTIAIHSVGIVGLVYDHRAFDGATASKFLLEVRDILQNRDWSADLG